MKDELLNLVWVWVQSNDFDISKDSLYDHPSAPITCIQTLPDQRTLCDIAFKLVDRYDLMDLLALAEKTNLQVESCITVSRLGIVRLYVQKTDKSDNGTH